MTAPDLQAGETVLHSWRISKRTFAIRVAVIVTVWIVIGQFGAYGQSLATRAMALPGSVVVGLFYMWVFGELNVWWDNRHAAWHLTNRAIHIAPGDDFPARIALTDIRRVHRWPFWSIVLRFHGGTAFTLPIPPYPSALRLRILAARAALLPQEAA